MHDQQTLDGVLGLQAALNTPDNDVNPLPDPASLTSRIAALALGGSIASLGSVDQWTRIGELSELVTDQRKNLRNNLHSSIRRATDRTGHVFSQEVTHVLMPGGRVFLLAVVTREE